METDPGVSFTLLKCRDCYSQLCLQLGYTFPVLRKGNYNATGGDNLGSIDGDYGGDGDSSGDGFSCFKYDGAS